jgi:HlyD family secretion protein
MPRSKFKITIVVIVVMIACAVTLYLVLGKSNNSVGKVVKYTEINVKKGTINLTVTANGTIIPIDRIEIKSKASGIVEELPVEVGDFIKKGDLIARLDQKDELAELGQAQANYDIAKAELKKADRAFERLDQLFKENLISEEERDQIVLNLAVANGKLVQATTSLDRAKERLSESIVRAPTDAVILQKYVEKGQIIASGVSSVSGGTAIVDIADMRMVYIQAGIDEIDVGKVHEGQSVTVMAEAHPQERFLGNIVRIAPEARIEQNVTLFDVIVEVENIEAKLKSGMNTTIEITTIRKDNVLLVPVTALQQKKGRSADKNIRTVLLKSGETFETQEVVIGLSNFRSTEVIEGLKQGDIIGVVMTPAFMPGTTTQGQGMQTNRNRGTSPR